MVVFGQVASVPLPETTRDTDATEGPWVGGAPQLAVLNLGANDIHPDLLEVCSRLHPAAHCTRTALRVFNKKCCTL